MNEFFAVLSLVVLLLALVAGVVQAQIESPIEPPGPPPPPEDPGEGSLWLGMLLVWVFGGGGASYLAYKLVEEVRRLRELPPRRKRFAAMTIAGVLAILGYLVAVAMLYENAPADWRAWIEQLVYVFGIGAMGSQVVHGLLKLPGGNPSLDVEPQILGGRR